MALTELAIKNLKPKDKNYLVSDGGGLSLAVSPSGSKLWRLRYYYQGKEQIMGIGKYTNIYELDELVDVKDPRIIFEGSLVKQQ
jgi:hypothetical protein